MNLQDLARQQHGYLLRCQVGDEEYAAGVASGFILDLTSREGVISTQLCNFETLDYYYEMWLAAFPTIPPSERMDNPPILGGIPALAVRDIGVLTTELFTILVPPELKQFASEDPYFDLVDLPSGQHVEFDLVHGIPTEPVLPALRRLVDDVPEFDWVAIAVVDVYVEHDVSRADLAWALENAVGRWILGGTDVDELIDFIFEDKGRNIEI